MENKPDTYVQIYRVALVKEAPMPTYDHRVRNSLVAADILHAYLKDADREHFVIIMVGQKNHVIGINTVSVGSLSASIVHPREVFKAAILANAAGIICGHNHPSGDCQPSEEDKAITHRLREAGRTLGIDVVDHIIIGEGTRYLSFADEGILT